MASRCSRPVAFIVLFQTMVEIDRDFHSAASYEAAALSLVLLPLSIVNLSMFSIPLLSKMHSTILSAEMFCKVKANFSNHQIFREKFLIFLKPPGFSAALLRPFRPLPWCRSQKRVQNYNTPPKPPNILQRIFSANFTTFYSIRYTSTN